MGSFQQAARMMLINPADVWKTPNLFAGMRLPASKIVGRRPFPQSAVGPPVYLVKRQSDMTGGLRHGAGFGRNIL